MENIIIRKITCDEVKSAITKANNDIIHAKAVMRCNNDKPFLMISQVCDLDKKVVSKDTAFCVGNVRLRRNHSSLLAQTSTIIVAKQRDGLCESRFPHQTSETKGRANALPYIP